MNNKKLLSIIAACGLTVSMFAFASCTVTPSTDTEKESVSESASDPSSEAAKVYGLPVATTGHYIKDADLLENDTSRYLAYTTNEESGEEDNVIAVRTAAFVQNEGWLYGKEKIVLRGGVDKWDEYIGSASVVKGTFEYGDAEYNWLMAYNATDLSSEKQNKIGLAVASEFDGEWVKVGETPLIGFDGEIYGTASVGCYSPSLINLDKASKIRICYTYADIYGHFAKFIDVDASDLDKLYTEEAKTDVTVISGEVQMPTNGNVAGGDAVTMFPNADFAYDAQNKLFFAVKDYSPSAATTPNYSEKIEFLQIAEEELYTVELLKGWSSIKLWDMTDTKDSAYERLYGACVVSDLFGHNDGAVSFEIVYNVCDVAADNADYLFSQNLAEFKVTLE